MRHHMYHCLLILMGGCLGCCVFTCKAQTPDPVIVTLDLEDTAQPIRNFGASGCWYSEAIGQHWPEAKKQRIAELLFSRALDESGSPLGIALSAWRFNIGAGTTEQGNQSGISDINRRVECFVDAKGVYDWNKQAGYRWFLEQAKAHGVETLIAFCNTPPVHFTRNGLGYKTTKDWRCNLRLDQYPAFADFLVKVVKHFDELGLHFDYLSPINEPQWDWFHAPGTPAKQEGCPWQNPEIYRAVRAIDSAFSQHHVTTQLLIPEAASLAFLYEKNDPNRANQIQAFWNKDSDLYLGDGKQLSPYVAGHSYFTDNGDQQLINTRKQVARSIDTLGQGLEFWQTEYCLLGDGFKEGQRGRVSEMDCALFVAKVIHHDLTIGQATAWQWWNAYEPGRSSMPRYYMIALSPTEDGKDGEFTPTKNLWALGHFSRFVRPGMKRLNIQRSDQATVQEAADTLMISAYTDEKTGKGVMVAINYLESETQLKLNAQGFSTAALKNKVTQYITTNRAAENMKAHSMDGLDSVFTCPPRSITTVTF